MIKKDKKDGINKEGIILEYFSQENTFKTLGKKYGIPFRTIQSWVRAYRESHPGIDKNFVPQTAKEKELKAELDRLQLKNQLLEEMLDLAENETGIRLRKKYGTKRS